MPLPGIPVEQYGEIASKLGLSVPWVWDLATYEEEAALTLSIRQVLALSAFTGIAPCDILGIDLKTPQNPELVTPTELCKALTQEFQRSNQEMSEFEEKLGWGIQGILDDPTTLYDVANWECLVDLASAVGIDPTALLPPPNEERRKQITR